MFLPAAMGAFALRLWRANAVKGEILALKWDTETNLCVACPDNLLDRLLTSIYIGRIPNRELRKHVILRR
jgi:hypothetical protein